MSRYNTEHVQLRMGKIRRCIKTLSLVIVVLSASQVHATLYVDPADSDASTYWIEEPCCTTISAPREFNSGIQLIQNEVDLADEAIPASDVYGMQRTNLVDVWLEVQAIEIHRGDLLLENTSISTPAGSMSVTAWEATPFGADILVNGGTIRVEGTTLENVSPVVPEPSMVALLVVGAVGIMVVRRRP